MWFSIVSSSIKYTPECALDLYIRVVHLNRALKLCTRIAQYTRNSRLFTRDKFCSHRDRQFHNLFTHNYNIISVEVELELKVEIKDSCRIGTPFFLTKYKHSRNEIFFLLDPIENVVIYDLWFFSRDSRIMSTLYQSAVIFSCYFSLNRQMS